MGAVFPNGIASFTTKRNLLDDVDASDINRLQDEIIAIESVLGALVTDVQEIESDVEELEEEQEQDDATEVVFRNRFKNLRKRIEYIADGYHIHAAELAITNKKIPRSERTQAKPEIVKFPKPSAAQDPRKMYNGTGLTLRRGGFWFLQGHVRYDVKSDQGKKNDGVYEASISVGDRWLRGMDRTHSIYDIDRLTGGKQGRDVWANVFCNPMVMGYFPRGSRIALRTGQASEVTQLMTHGFLSAVWLRSPSEVRVPDNFLWDFPVGPR